MPAKRRQNSQSGFDDRVLDSVNRLILRELQADARLTMAELGRRVGLSAPSVADRVLRLERTGVIVGYRTELDPRALGFPILASVRVRPGMGQLHKIPQVAQESPEVVECHRITGEDCYLLSVRLQTMDDLEEVLDRFTLYGQTTTSIVHSTPVERRLPPVDTVGSGP